MAMNETTGTWSNEPERGSSGVGQVVGQAQQRVGAVADQVQQAAAPVVDQAQQTVATQVDSQKDRAVEALASVAQAVRQTSHGLRGQNQEVIARYADRAADAVERAAGYLRQRDTGQIVDEAEWWARRNPSLFLAGGFTLGLIAARFFKSSAPRPRYSSGSYGQSPYRTHPYATQGYGAQDDAATYGMPTPYATPSASGAPLYGATGPVATPPTGTTPATDFHLTDQDRPTYGESSAAGSASTTETDASRSGDPARIGSSTPSGA